MKMAEQQDWRGDDLSDVLDIKSLLIPAKKTVRNPLSLLISDHAGEEEGWQEKYGRDEEGNLIVTDPKEREQNFRHWFGDSKVVDKGGKPLAMYHGTLKGGFSEFDPSKGVGGLLVFGKGSYFTEDPEMASEYSGQVGEIYKVNLSIQNPIDMDAKADKSQWEKFKNALPKELQGGFEEYENELIRSWAGRYKGASLNEDMYFVWHDYLRSKDLNPTRTEKGGAIMQAGLKAMGHDGITHIDPTAPTGKDKPHRVYIIFDPTQVKSVHNRGLYNPADPNILSKRVNPKKSLKIPA